jgi:sodium transport system permease protein
VTGVALLMQKVMTAPSLASVPWLYFIPVLGPMALYSGLALRWAIEQFQREEVLFREAERLDVGLWVRSLLRDKEPTASPGQAYFLFALLLGLAWMGLGIGGSLPLPLRTSIGLLAFVLAPTLILAIMLNSRPVASLQWRWPRPAELGLAALLAVLFSPPLVWISGVLLVEQPRLQRLLEDPQPFLQEIRALTEGSNGLGTSVLVFALLPALCEELAFRGLILTGLRKRYRARTAVLLCSFLSALFHMNVFTFVPIFGLSVVLGLLTVRSGSVVPAMLFHFLSKAVLVLSHPLGSWVDRHLPADLLVFWPQFVSACFGVAVILVWNLYRKPYVEEALRHRSP